MRRKKKTGTVGAGKRRPPFRKWAGSADHTGSAKRSGRVWIWERGKIREARREEPKRRKKGGGERLDQEERKNGTARLRRDWGKKQIAANEKKKQQAEKKRDQRKKSSPIQRRLLQIWKQKRNLTVFTLKVQEVLGCHE